MRKTALIITIIMASLAGGAYLLTAMKADPPQSAKETTHQAVQTKQIKAAHFESSTPEHGAKLAGAPNQVVIDFNFDLSEKSSISVKNNNQEYTEGQTTIDNSKLAMRRNLKTSAPDGTYEVTYIACWPDNSCHEGSFSFIIDRSMAASFTDHRNQPEITIMMSQIKFQPENLKITKGTKVTWVNDDTVDHYVNTDSHPAHTHQPDLSSRALKKGQSYSHTFAAKGLYPYHCSAHAENMTGNILVE